MAKKDTKFKKGQSGNPTGRPNGAVSEKTKFWNEMKGFMINEGAQKFQEELMKLKGNQFVFAYANALEYFQPKLSRTTVEGNPDKPVGPTVIINKIVTKDVRNRPKDNSTAE